MNRLRLMRWLLAASLLIAVGVLSGIVWRSWGATSLRSHDLAQDIPVSVVPIVPPRVEPRRIEPSPIKVAREELAESRTPTWFELRRAIAQSDEAFETLLARNSGAMFSAPINSQTLLQESF